MDNACSQNGRWKECFKILAGKPTRKRLLGKPRSRWEENIRMDLKEIAANTRNWIDLAHDRNNWSPYECGIEPVWLKQK